MEDKEMIKGLVNYISNTEMGKKLEILKGIIKSIIAEGEKIEEVKKILKVKGFEREMSIAYCQEHKEEKVVRIYKKRNKMTLREVDKEEVDREKTAAAYFVNVVHFIDAGICYSIMKEMLLLDKAIICIHDCFGTLYSDIEIIETMYITILKREENKLKLHILFENIFKKVDEVYTDIQSKKNIGYMSDLEKKKYIQNYSKIIDLLEESKEINLL
jgi:hypothetical protein